MRYYYPDFTEKSEITQITRMNQSVFLNTVHADSFCFYN